MVEQKRASLTEFAKGGLLDDVDVVFSDVRAEMYDYNGSVIPPNPALGITLVYGEGEDDVTRQYWSIGKHEDWMASEDGSYIVKVGTKDMLSESCNYFLLYKSLKEAGYPVEQLDGDKGFAALNGLKCHMIRVAAPTRAGLDKKKKINPATGKAYEDTVLIVQSILGAQGEGPKAEAPKQDAAPAADVEAQAIEVVNKYLAANGKLEKKDLPTKIYEMLKENPAKNVILQMLFKDEFVSQHFNVVEGVIFAKDK